MRFWEGHKINLGRKWTEEEKRQIGDRSKGRKHTEEAKRKMSLIKMGKKNPFYGKHHTEEAKRKFSRGGQRHTEESKQIMRMNCHRGQEHHNWKGGITDIKKKIRDSFLYRQWRSDVFTRNDFTCNGCNRRGGKLHAHHIVPLADIVLLNDIETFEQAIFCEELWNINNGITYCIYCHKEKHRELAILSTESFSGNKQ